MPQHIVLSNSAQQPELFGEARLILARHGQNALDADDRFNDGSDPALTAEGREESHALASTLALLGNVHIDYVISSPSRACSETADIVVRRIGCRFSAMTDGALDERTFGQAAGLTRAEAVDRLGPERTYALQHAGDGAEEAIASSAKTFKDRALGPLMLQAKTILDQIPFR